MALDVGPRRGGFRRPIQLSLFIRDAMSNGRQTHAFEIYKEYKEAVRAIPPRKKGCAKRRCISYHGFLDYMFILRKLGLIEYVKTPGGRIVHEVATTKGGDEEAAYLAKTNIIQIVSGQESNPAWQNPWQASYG